jgi:hypothetical protein
MSEVLNNVFYLGIGMMIGLVLGWTLRTMRYTQQVRNMLARRDQHGWYTHKISLGIVVAFTAGAAIWTGVVNSQLQKNQDCTEKAVNGLVISLNERTSLSTKLNLASAEKDKAFSTLFTAILSQPQPPENELRELFRDYANKLNRYNGLQDSQRTTQDANPFPESVDYKSCLRK